MQAYTVTYDSIDKDAPRYAKFVLGKRELDAMVKGIQHQGEILKRDFRIYVNKGFNDYCTHSVLVGNDDATLWACHACGDDITRY